MTFERKVAVQYLAHLLVGDGAVELGDARSVVSVAFQQSPEHSVDDLVVHAARGNEGGSSLVLALGVRRSPNLVGSDVLAKKLFRSFVSEVGRFPTAGPERRVGLVVAGSQSHTMQLAQLADHAKFRTSADSYFGLIHEPVKFSADVRGRLNHIETLVRLSLMDLGLVNPSTQIVRERTLQLLSSLTVLSPRLETPDETDWATVTNMLVPIARGGNLTGASRLRDRLLALVDEYAPKAAVIDLELLRRDTHNLIRATGRRSRQGSKLVSSSEADPMNSRLTDEVEFLDREVEQDVEYDVPRLGSASVIAQDVELTALIARWPISRAARLQMRSRQARRRLLDRILHSDVLRLDSRWPDFNSLQLSIPSKWTLSGRRQKSSDEVTISKDTNLISLYSRSGGSLLLLGEAGAGKSREMRTLTRDLAFRAVRDPLEPIPLLLEIAAFGSHVGDFTSWLVDAAREQYGLTADVAETWLANDQVVLLLDGLDELCYRDFKAFVKTLNRFIDRKRLTGIVVACRTQDYRSYSRTLTLRGSLELQRLEIGSVLQVIEKSSLAGLSRAVTRDRKLQDLLRNPLLLQLAVVAFNGVSEDKIQRGGHWREAILDAYVTRASERSLPATASKASTVAPLDSWLPHLAKHMRITQSVILYPDRLALDMTPTEARKTISRTATLMAALVVMAVMVIPRAMVLAFSERSALSLWYASLTVVTTAFTIGILAVYIRRRVKEPAAGRRMDIKQKLRGVLLRWAIAQSLLSGLLTISALTGRRLPEFLVLCAVLGVSMYPAVALVKSKSSTDVRDAPARPFDELGSLLRCAVGCSAIVLATLFVTIFLAVGPLSASPGLFPADPVTITFYFALPFVVTAGMANGGCDYLIRQAAVRVNAQRGWLPRPYVASFYAAQRSSILVLAGGGYRFTHLLVRDHLAGSYGSVVKRQ